MNKEMSVVYCNIVITENWKEPKYQLLDMVK